MKKLLFVLFSITIASMCLGELNLSEKKMIIDTPCPDGIVYDYQDCNSDGILDAIMISNNDKSVYAITNLCENDENIEFLEILPEDSFQGDLKSCVRLDDSNLTLITSSELYIVNIDSGTIHHYNEGSNSNQILCSDMNNDGSNEIILVGEPEIDIFTYTPATGLTNVYHFNSPSAIKAVSTGTINQNNFRDIFVTIDNEIILIKNNGDFTFTLSTINVSIIYTNPINIFFADHDGDGDTDIYECRKVNTDSLYVKTYINNNGSFNTSSISFLTYSSESLQRGSKLKYVADFNNDNKADLCFEYYVIIGAIENNCFQYYNQFVTNNNGSFENVSNTVIGDFAIMDVNNDSYKDIVTYYKDSATHNNYTMLFILNDSYSSDDNIIHFADPITTGVHEVCFTDSRILIMMD